MSTAFVFSQRPSERPKRGNDVRSLARYSGDAAEILSPYVKSTTNNGPGWVPGGSQRGKDVRFFRRLLGNEVEILTMSSRYWSFMCWLRVRACRCGLGWASLARAHRRLAGRAFARPRRTSHRLDGGACMNMQAREHGAKRAEELEFLGQVERGSRSWSANGL